MDISTIVFALLAIFVVWKLYSVLGTRTGNERPPTNPFNRGPVDGREPPPAEPRGRVIPMPAAPQRPSAAAPAEDPARWGAIVQPGSAAARGLDEIARAEPGFDPDAFLKGAGVAYEHILLAFAKGDRDALRPLLSPDVFEGFNGAVTGRETRGETVETTFVSLGSGRVDDARLLGRSAQISVRFEAKIITATRSKEGAIIEGDPQQPTDIVDVWTFARDVGSSNPNWTLIATENHN